MTQKLKRYDISVYEVPFEGCQGTMAPSVDGKYVLYSDILPLIEFVKKCALPKLTTEQIEVRKNWTAERSYGNYGDCFLDGQDCSDAWTASDARQALASVGVE